MKILITGSSGTIGTRLFEKLLEQGYDVVGFDKKKNKWHDYLDKPTIKGDLLSESDVNKIPKDVELIIHLAANARVYDLVQSPNLALENVISTYNMLEFARKNNINKIIFSSSREVYGNRKRAIAKEDDARIEFSESPYSASKISNESFIHAYSRCYGLEYVLLRFSNVYGMYDESDRFIPLIIKKMKKNEDVFIFGKDKVLDFTYIDDCIEGIIICIRKFAKAKSHVFNIASGKGSRLTEVAKKIKTLMNSTTNIRVKNSRNGEVIRYIANISKAKKVLGYYPSRSLEESIPLTVDWYTKQS